MKNSLRREKYLSYQKKWRDEHKEYQRIYRKQHKEKIREYAKVYEQQHKEVILEKKRARYMKNRKNLAAASLKYYKKHRDEIIKRRKLQYPYKPESEKISKHPNYKMWLAAKKCAKKYSLPFTITLDDISIPKLCPYLEIPLFRGDKTHCANSPSLDKIIPALGYIPGNIQVISYKANLMKNDASIERLITFAHNILRLHETV